MPASHEHVQALADYIAEPNKPGRFPVRREVHPMHGGNPLSWPIIDEPFELPIPNIRAAIFQRKFGNAFLSGSFNVRDNSFEYGNRLEIGLGIGIGKREVAALDSISDVQLEDLSTISEIAGLSKVKILLYQNKIDMYLNHHNCIWPKDTRDIRRGHLAGTLALKQSLLAYRNVAKIGFDNYIQSHGLTEFYQDWKFLKEERGQVTSNTSPDIRNGLQLNVGDSLAHQLPGQGEIFNFLQDQFYKQWTDKGVFI